MFLPIGDTPNPRGRPWITYLLIAANVSIFVLISWPLMLQAPDFADNSARAYVHYLANKMGIPVRSLLPHISAYDVFIFQHGFKPAEPSVVSLFSSMFLHAGWMHLLGNMLFLWIFGDNVEAALGRLGYFFTYICTGIAATLFFALFQLGSLTPLVGASGAISGVLGYYFLRFPRNRVRVLMLWLWIIDVIYVPARLVLGIYLIIDNVLPFVLHSGAGGVAHGAHIGGFLGGLGVAAFLRRRRGVLF